MKKIKRYFYNTFRLAPGVLDYRINRKCAVLKLKDGNIYIFLFCLEIGCFFFLIFNLSDMIKL